MSRSVLATVLAVGFSWLAVSCAGPFSIQLPGGNSHPAAPAASAAHPGGSASIAKATMSPSAPVALVSLAGPPVAAAVGPWKGAGIFFYPFVLIVLAFAIGLYKSTAKTD